MIFREFATETLDAVRMLAGGVSGGRDITPMVHLQTQETERELIAVDPLFFTADGGLRLLVDRFVIPLVQEREAMKVAWTFTGTARTGPGAPTITIGEPEYGGDLRVASAVIIDREVCEMWIAPVYVGPRVGTWLQLPANEVEGPMVGPVQEALR